MGRHLKIIIVPRVPSEPWNSDQALAHALAERTRFLEKHPHHRKFQREIDRLLDKAGSVENRLTVLALLIEAKLIDLHHHLGKLNGILLQAVA